MKKLITALILAIAAPVFGSGVSTNDTRVLLWERTSEDTTGVVEADRWDYAGPVLGSWGRGDSEHISGGLQVEFKFGSFNTIAKDVALGVRVIRDEIRGPDATIASIMMDNPASFYAADGATPAPLPADEAERLANAQSDGPGFWSKPSTWLTGGTAAAAAWYLSEQNGKGGGGGTTIAIDGSGNAVNTGSGSASASTSTAPPPEPVIVNAGN